MSRISEEVIEQTRKGNDVVDIVTEYVQLKKQGRNYFGLCPFHQENSPSFSVSEEKQIFHCFGCGKGGNVITFIMEIESFSFIEALNHLAAKAQIELPEIAEPTKKHVSSFDTKLLSAYEWLTKFYHHMLYNSDDGSNAEKYLTNRGTMKEGIDRFQIGYAPNTSEFTTDFLLKKGFEQDVLIQGSVLNESEQGRLIDRFRGRVIFPIRNHHGQTVGFGGRAIGEEQPKYLNSPESELFQKSKVLYNFDLAKNHIRKSSEVVLCEGYMDVIASDGAGVLNSVATLGTALTEFQARMLSRYAKTVILCYDADKAGLAATYKAGLLLETIGTEVKVANLHDGLDPDSYIKEFGAEAFQREVIGASDTFNGFFIRYLKRQYNLSLEGERIEYIEKVTERLASIDRVIEREFYLKELATEYDITLEILQEQVDLIRKSKRIVGERQKRQQERSAEKPLRDQRLSMPKKTALRPAYYTAERKLLAHMLTNSMIADRVQGRLGARFNVEQHQVIVTYLYAHYEDGGHDDMSEFIQRLPDEQCKQLVTELAMLPLDENISDEVIDDYIYMILQETNDQPSLRKLKEEQKQAERENDPIKAAQIAMQMIKLQQSMKREHH